MKRKPIYMDDVELGKIELITSDMTEKEIEKIEKDVQERIDQLPTSHQ